MDPWGTEPATVRGAASTACPGCGEWLPDLDGATHPYVGASSACWTRFADINAMLPPVTPLRRLVTDAYMVQHPGVPERRAIQSVGVHLMALRLVLVNGLPPDRLSETLQAVMARPPAWRWLEPPVPNGRMTIGALASATAPDELARRIDGYVRGVWTAWSAHHAVVEAWVRDAGLERAGKGRVPDRT
jgi:hypothetical protein